MGFGKRMNEVVVAEQVIAAERLRLISSRGRAEATVYDGWVPDSDSPSKKLSRASKRAARA
jgi:hypothetical protein